MKKLPIIEIIVSILVLTILSMIGYYSVIRMNQKMRDTKRINDMISIEQAMKLLKKETGTYLNACGDENYSGAVSSCIGDGQSFKLYKYLTGLSEANDPSLAVDLCQAGCPRRPCNYNFNKISKDNYQIFFYLEAGVENFTNGCYQLTESGIKTAE